LTEPSSATTDLPLVIEQAVEAASGRTGEQPVAVIAEYPAHLPAIQGEQSELVLVTTSLLQLAVSSVRRGEVRVKAEITSGQAGGGQIDAQAPAVPSAQLSVRLPPGSVNPAQFEELRAELEGRSPTRPAARHQLGLAECRQAIEAFSGVLWLEPLPQEGLLMAFAVPLRAAQAARADVSELRSMVEAHLPEGEEPTRTLLVMAEDDGLRDLLARDLGQAGYRVVSTGRGGEVLGLARQEKPDLVLLDMMARDPAALDVAIVLKQDRQTLGMPVLFLTSMPDPLAGGLRLGAASFLVRPVGTGALISTIQAVLGSGISPAGRVLVVESDEATRETMVMMIQAHGYRVTEAAAAEEALALAEHVPPELVLVSARIAQDRDYWLLRGLKQLSQEVDVFVLAEAYSEADRRAAVDRGAAGYSETGKLSQLLDEVRRKQDRS
jgi:DNA-binding response OmpR family regulator